MTLPTLSEPDGDAFVDARPTKRFFVRMLVRDIELVPAIVDLIDNSIDGAKRLAGGVANSMPNTALEGHPAGARDWLEDRYVDIQISESEFSISDNCGGIPLGVARGYAFRFGRLTSVTDTEGEVGQFGVGLKRALFKIGNHFEVASYTDTESFTVEADLPEWIDDSERWAFPLDIDASERSSAPGTYITVSKLYPSVAQEFAKTSFLSRLREEIEFRHQIVISAGFTIRLNGTKLNDRPLELLSSDAIKPRTASQEIVDAETGDVVTMRLFSGFVSIPDEEADEADGDQFHGGGLAGWYLVCNGRMLLFADKSRRTGWGDEVADYHPQYRRFRGYVYLDGPSGAMPWNTAKTAVDEDSSVWQQVRTQIVDALREARTVLNRLKSERQSRPEDDRPLAEALDKAKPTPLASLKPSDRIYVPPKPPRLPAKTKTIQYSVTRDEFDQAASALGTTSGAEIGRRTFNYYLEEEL